MINFDSTSFKNLIKSKESIINKKYQETSFKDDDNFIKLHRNLVSYYSTYGLTEFKAILIKKEEVSNIEEDIFTLIKKTLGKSQAITNNHIIVDRKFNLISSEKKNLLNNNLAKDLYIEISKEDFCVFLHTPSGVDYFVDGYFYGETIFFTSDEYDNYKELKKVGDLLNLIEDYRAKVKIRSYYRSFFVSNSAKKAVYKNIFEDNSYSGTQDDFLTEYKQLLVNKPEDSFRESLRLFLKDNLSNKILLGKEHQLDNFKRLDILIFDDYGELYFIEVKWVGTSVHHSGLKIGTSYTEDNINTDAVFQTLDYIRELHETSNKIQIGYLVVFDARDGTNEDTVNSFDENSLDSSLKPYYPRFQKIPDIKVVNTHPF